MFFGGMLPLRAPNRGSGGTRSAIRGVDGSLRAASPAVRVGPRPRPAAPP